MLNVSRLIKLAVSAGIVALMAGCATPPPPYDYTALRASKPKSILVLPPLNESPEVNAGNSVLAQVTYPLAESGYYVMPVSLVVETFHQNGLTQAADMQAVAPAKLREIFGADAALYMTVKRYGSTYTVLSSTVVVAVSAKLVDLKTGATLWQGEAAASSAENQGANQGGLIGLLVTAVVNQIVHSVSDTSHPVAGIATKRLLMSGRSNGLLAGPRSPRYGQD